MARRWIPRVCFAVFPIGIAGLIVSSIRGNNNGIVLSFGAFIAVAVMVLLTHSAVLGTDRIDAFDDAVAETLEAQIIAVVAQGADEHTVRALVRDALRAGRH